MDPWILLGWLLLAILIVVTVLIAAMMRRRKRSIREFRARRREIQRGLQQPRLSLREFSLRDWKD